MGQKITEIEQEVREHKLVLGVFDDVETDRKAWRLVGGVLIPGTVGEIRPQIVENKEKIEQVIQQLTKQLEMKSKQVAAFEQKYGQKPAVRAPEPPEASQSDSKDKGAAGGTGV